MLLLLLPPLVVVVGGVGCCSCCDDIVCLKWERKRVTLERRVVGRGAFFRQNERQRQHHAQLLFKSSCLSSSFCFVLVRNQKFAHGVDYSCHRCSFIHSVGWLESVVLYITPHTPIGYTSPSTPLTTRRRQANNKKQTTISTFEYSHLLLSCGWFRPLR